uniref:Uncharacterized protein n=1 Tax=Setaria italica TaxID=4555 RepID=K3Y3Y4_SETIT
MREAITGVANELMLDCLAGIFIGSDNFLFIFFQTPGW